MSASEKLILQLAAKELHAYNLQRWCDHGEFLWDKWPYSAREFDVLKRAARSSRIGCKGGLINELGQADMSCNEAVWRLQASGMMVDNVPSELGWAMLRHFAEPNELSPPRIDTRSLVMRKPRRGPQ